MSAEPLIEPHEILDMAKRHDTLPDAPGIKLEDSNILDFTDELLALFVERVVARSGRGLTTANPCKCGVCQECNWARTHE